MSKLYKIDFYRDFRLPRPFGGIIRRVNSPKGIRRIGEANTIYKLQSDILDIYDGDPFLAIPGLYWILDIHSSKGMSIWSHYLFIVEEDGKIYPIAEYPDEVDTEWVRSALPIVKAYFNHQKLEPIELVTKKVRRQQKEVV